MDNDWKLLGKRIQARIDAGFKKAELCRKAGISGSQLDSYLPRNSDQKKERILRAPGLDTAERIADALGEPLSLTDLINDTILRRTLKSLFFFGGFFPLSSDGSLVKC